MPPLTQPRVTPEEYLRLERASERRHDLVNGEIRAIAGASWAHNHIAGNIYAPLRAALRGRPCNVMIGGVRLKVGQTGMYTYPDVAALCGKPDFEDEHGDTLLNPSVIFEVLSPLTERYDRGEKFAHYRRLESLREYVLVSQDRIAVEVYVRHGDRWMLSELTNPAGVLRIESLACDLSLSAIYQQVTFGGEGS